MELLRPICGNRTVHDQHESLRYDQPVTCPGWDSCSAATTSLILQLHEYAREHRPPLSMPEGICLLAHPEVYHRILRCVIPSYGQAEPDVMPPAIPLVITTALPRGAWQLGTFTVISEGVIS
jgi:hypothetical protein